MTEDRVPVDPTTEAAVGSFVAAMRALFGSLAHGEWTEPPGSVLYGSGLLLPRFNGVVVLGADADEGTVAAWLDELVFAGRPHAVLSRPAAPSWVARLATSYDLTTVEHEPFMCLADPATVGAGPGDEATPLVIDLVDPTDPEQVGAAARLLAEGFEAPVELLAPLVAPELLALPGMTAYVGRTDGEPCATGFGAVAEGHVGVFNIATPPAHRRHGFGRAVTSRIVADGVRAGAHAAYLQASPMGVGVYERLGFRTVETWTNYYPG